MALISSYYKTNIIFIIMIYIEKFDGEERFWHHATVLPCFFLGQQLKKEIL